MLLVGKKKISALTEKYSIKVIFFKDKLGIYIPNMSIFAGVHFP